MELYVKIKRLVLSLSNEPGHIAEWTNKVIKLTAFPLFSLWDRQCYLQLFFGKKRISLGLILRTTNHPKGLQ